MRIDVLTLFPAAFTGPLDVSILRRAREAGLLDLHLHDIREHALDRHRSVDDYPYGGGQGMVMRVDVLDRALGHVQGLAESPGHVILLSPAGERLDDRLVRELASFERLVLVCGRYEGVDERFIQHCVDREVSVGDFILTGGELPAMVLIDAVTRHVPGALGDDESPEDESFRDGLLEHPQYTRPEEYRGWRVPRVLLGGDHAAIAAWKQAQRLERTRARRPDLATNEQVRPRLSRRARTIVRGLAVRTYRHDEDRPAVDALWREAGLDPHLGPREEERELLKRLDRDPELFLVAVDSGRVVGAVLGGWDGWRGYVHRLAVAEAARARGVGSMLMDELERRLAAKGCTRMQVVARGAAGAWFERHGWTRRDFAVYTRELPS